MVHLLEGGDAESLRALARDLAAHASAPEPTSPDVVRVYGEPGGTVSDLRTGVRTPWRAVRKGRLEPFHEAWAATTASGPSSERHMYHVPADR